MSWQQAIILEKEEHVVHSWEGDYEKPYKSMKGDHRRRKYIEKEETKRKKGILVLTNLRILWFERRGFIGKSYHALFEIYLRSLKGISMGGRLHKYVSITDENTEYRFHLNGVGKKELETFKDMILRQAEKIKEKVAMTSPTYQKEVIIKEVVMMPCDYCKALMPQTSVFCPSCGARRKG